MLEAVRIKFATPAMSRQRGVGVFPLENSSLVNRSGPLAQNLLKSVISSNRPAFVGKPTPCNALGHD